jgi:hypothetical protein
MSDISVIDNQYKKLVDTSDKINNSVITLKKQNLLFDKKAGETYPQLKVSTDEVSKARTTLLSFLGSLQMIVQGTTQESEFIPPLILEDYKRKLVRNQFLQEDVKDIIGKLSSNQPIESKYITVLDDILSILDIERSTLFRKLRTARG